MPTDSVSVSVIDNTVEPWKTLIYGDLFVCTLPTNGTFCFDEIYWLTLIRL